MNDGNEELTIVFLDVLHYEATIQTIVNLTAQAAALQGSESTSSERGDYSVRPGSACSSKECAIDRSSKANCRKTVEIRSVRARALIRIECETQHRRTV
jgi:hypothetical protein